MFAQHHELRDTIESLTPKWSFWAVHVDQGEGLLACEQGPVFGPQLHRMT